MIILVNKYFKITKKLKNIKKVYVKKKLSQQKLRVFLKNEYFLKKIEKFITNKKIIFILIIL